jgi:hypothetical protein
MANIATLKPFPPGVSGNPAGRPKGALSITNRVRAALEVGVTEQADFADKLVEVVMQKALEGNEHMIRLVWSYIDGKPKQESVVEVTIPTPIMSFDEVFKQN